MYVSNCRYLKKLKQADGVNSGGNKTLSLLVSFSYAEMTAAHTCVSCHRAGPHHVMARDEPWGLSYLYSAGLISAVIRGGVMD